jgi:shikimate dehydrogenase
VSVSVTAPIAAPITAMTRMAGVVGHPVRHSLSPVIHNAWLKASDLDAVYLAFAPTEAGFEALVEGLRGGVVLGLNVTIPFKEAAAALADHPTPQVLRAGAANLLLFRPDGSIAADNTDGVGLLHALDQAGFAPFSPVVVLGAGGAARGAVLSLLDVGVPSIRLVNRSLERARAIAALDGRITVHGWDEAPQALDGVAAVINATSLGMTGQPPLELSLDTAPPSAVVMDMVYKPLRTGLLENAARRGHPTADGLSMLIGQAIPSFTAMFGAAPPMDVDVRGLCERALGERA